MNKLQKLALAMGAVAAMGSAQAINVGGVVWDPNSFFDFTAGDAMVETSLGAAPSVGDTIQGYARITAINGTGETTFCPGCELTYFFSGFTVTGVSATDITFSGGNIKVYVDSTPNYDQTKQSTAVDGVLWLELAGAVHVDLSTGNVGTLHSDPTPTGTGLDAAGDGRGYMNVIGGLAAMNFDTNTRAIVLPGGATGFADFQFTSSFQLLDGGGFVSDDGVRYGLFGTNDLRGNSVAIPEPTGIALLSLAMLGLGLSRRSRR